MKLHNISTHKQSALHNGGFSLIEILVVVGIFALLASMGLSYSVDSYRGTLFRGEYNNVVHMLAKARNRSANNFNESAYIFEMTADSYLMYPEDYPAEVDTFPRNTAIDIAGPSLVAFEQLSGNLTDCDGIDPCALTFTFQGKDKTITINELGGITW